jgi:hypothetical protein
VVLPLEGGVGVFLPLEEELDKGPDPATAVLVLDAVEDKELEIVIPEPEEVREEELEGIDTELIDDEDIDTQGCLRSNRIRTNDCCVNK